MTEVQLYQVIKKIIKKDYKDIYPVRIENSVASGLPDVVLISDRNIFIELKTGNVPKLREKQISFFLKAVIIGNPNYFVLTTYREKAGNDKYVLYCYSESQPGSLESFKVRKKNNKYYDCFVPCVKKTFNSIDNAINAIVKNQ